MSDFIDDECQCLDDSASESEIECEDDGREHRSWSITVNPAAYAEKGLRSYEDWILQCPGRRYAIVGRESAPSTGTRHLQAHVQFSNAIGFRRLQRLLPGACLKYSQKSPWEGREYCKKDGDFRETGLIPTKNGRSDLAALSQQVSDGRSVRSMLTKEDGAMYNRPHQIRTCEAIMKYLRPRKRITPKCYWFHGVTGGGKTYAVMQAIEALGFETEGDEVYWWNGTKWFDGYDQDPILVMDEFRGEASGIPIQLLLRIMDGHPLYVDVKGTGTTLPITHIFITSPKPPELVYDFEDGTQVRRRCTEITHLSHPFEPEANDS